jgi:hypothetical protein
MATKTRDELYAEISELRSQAKEAERREHTDKEVAEFAYTMGALRRALIEEGFPEEKADSLVFAVVTKGGTK